MDMGAWIMQALKPKAYLPKPDRLLHKLVIKLITKADEHRNQIVRVKLGWIALRCVRRYRGETQIRKMIADLLTCHNLLRFNPTVNVHWKEDLYGEVAFISEVSIEVHSPLFRMA